MSEEFDRLRAALQNTPKPDANTRDAHLRAALESFDQAQETPDEARQTNMHPQTGAGFLKGISTMFKALTSRAALGMTTGLVTAGLAVILIAPLGQDVMAPPTAIEARSTESEAPADAPILPQPNLEEAIVAIDDRTRAEASQSEAATTTQPSGGVSLQGRAEVGIAGGYATPQANHRSVAPTPKLAFDASDLQVTPHEMGDFAGIAPGRKTTQGTIPQDALNDLESPVEALIIPSDPVNVSEQPNTDTFANEEPNPLKVTAQDPVSTVSIDVDTASYAVVRASLMNGYLPPKDAVRVEEMVNYFPYSYAAPDTAPFSTSVNTFQTPWNAGTQLVHIGLQGQLPALADRPPLNLVFLIDTSGSMQHANKLPLLKQSLRLMLSELRPDDQVAIVTYAGSAGQVLEPTPAAERAKITATLDNLQAGGSTAGQAGLQQAYAVAEGMMDEGDVTRVLLATDGDFNVGLSDPEALETFIADKRDSGTYLSVLGFGRGNLDDATMQALAQNGNGQAAYIDTLSEARKVLVDQLSGALFPIANDVKIQVEFNPATIAEYRLIGYETRALRREGFNNDKVDAGEIGAGHTVTALYEVTPVGSDATLTDPLRYGQAAPDGPTDELGFLRLRYKQPGATKSQLIETPIQTEVSQPGTEARFAAAIAGFGQLLRDDTLLGDWSYADAIALANGAKADDPFGYRAEAITLMRLAESLSQN